MLASLSMPLFAVTGWMLYLKHRGVTMPDGRTVASARWLSPNLARVVLEY